MFKVNNENTGTTSTVLVFLLLTLNKFHIFSDVSNVDFEQVNVFWVIRNHKTLNWNITSAIRSCSKIFSFRGSFLFVCSLMHFRFFKDYFGIFKCKIITTYEIIVI